MENPEAIYLNWGQDGEVIADFTPVISDILIDAFTYGFALRETTNALGIIRHDPNHNQAIFFADNEIVRGRIPELESRAAKIAFSCSFEQPNYNRAEAQKCRIIVDGILANLVKTLPVTTAEKTFMDTCEQIILPFAKVTVPEEGSELKMLQNVNAPWRMTPEERQQFELSIAEQAEHYLQVLGGK